MHTLIVNGTRTLNPVDHKIHNLPTLPLKDINNLPIKLKEVMSLTLCNVSAIISQYELEVAECTEARSSNSNPFLSKLVLQKIYHDLPRLLRAVNEHKNSKSFSSIHAQILRLSHSVDENSYQLEETSKAFLEKYQKVEKTPAEDRDEYSSSPSLGNTEPSDNDDYMSLRKRLLADGATTSLDKDASREQMNNYHETFQEDLIGDLSELATALKNSARSLSAKIVDDASLVSETSENMMKSSSLMQSVGTNLNAYLSEKTGGKITIFFMIKTMVFVFVLFFFMVVLAKILPKM